MSNAIVHGVINTLVYVATALLFLIPLTWLHWWWIVFFGIIFDVDHVPYYLLHTRPLTIQNLKTSVKEDYAKQVPHFYACHTLEFQVLLVCLCVGTGGTIWSIWVVTGWGIHLVTDVVSYLRWYHGFNPWGKYWSIGYYSVKIKNSLAA